MNVISRRKLRAFYRARRDRRGHAAAFEGWFKLTRKAHWHTFQDAKALFGQTDVARDTRSRRTATIFDIGGNKYRIVVWINYLYRVVYVRFIGTHRQYDGIDAQTV